MRRPVLTVAAACTAILVAGVMTYQAFNQNPPEPYVRIAGQIEPPMISRRCIDGEVVLTYETAANAEREVIPLERLGIAC